MEESKLTFLNTTGASRLSQPTAKRMRAHITKSNFAKRRQARSLISSEVGANKDIAVRQDCQDVILRCQKLTKSNPNIGFPMCISIEPARDIGALHKIQKLVFLEGRHSPSSASEAAWFNLIASDPALIEASMAIAVRNWSPDNSWQLKATGHSCTAVTLIKRRIMSTAIPTDGVLGAVITMAFGASLENDDLAWNIHINGLAHIIEERKSQGTEALPSWLTGLVVQDSVNAIFNFPRLYHERLINALVDCNHKGISKLKTICGSFIQLQKSIDAHRQHQLASNFVAREIEEPLANLHYEVRALRTTNDPYLDVAARSIELVLYLTWPSQSGAHLTFLAGELKEAICGFPIKGCSYMNLTSFPLMIGAIAAERESLTRAWFVDRMAREVRAMQMRGWNEPLSLLQDRYMTSGGFMGRFQAPWLELYQVAAELEL